MKLLFWFGVVAILLGVLSLFIPLPHTERQGFSAGDMSVTMQTQHSETVSPFVSVALILGGAGMMVAGRSAVRA